MLHLSQKQFGCGSGGIMLRAYPQEDCACKYASASHKDPPQWQSRDVRDVS